MAHVRVSSEYRISATVNTRLFKGPLTVDIGSSCSCVYIYRILYP